MTRRCEICAFERLASLDDDDLVFAVERCGDCPRLQDPVARDLLERLRGSARELRRSRSRERQKTRELAEFEAGEGARSLRMTRLERAQQKSMRELEEKTSILWLLSSIATAANSTTSVEEMMHLCLPPLCQVADFDFAVALFGEEAGMHYVAQAEDPGAIGDLLRELDLDLWSRRAAAATSAEPVFEWTSAMESDAREPWRGALAAMGIAESLTLSVVTEDSLRSTLFFFSAKGVTIPRSRIDPVLRAVLLSLSAQLGRVYAREAAEAATVAAREAAEGANQAKSDFVASMSHELRTPLNAIIGYGEMLIEDLEEAQEDECLETAHFINRASRHLLALINNILDMSKIEAGKMLVVPERTDLIAAVDDVVMTLIVSIEQRGNHLVREVASLTSPVMVDGLKVRQILFNLIGNAAKFTQDGRITLRVELVPHGKEGLVLRIEVEDTGIGMTPEQASKIFNPFTQADGDVASTYGGTGLGLTLCRRFAELMGGTIGVTSRPGVGSCFRVELPVTRVDGG